MPMITLASFVVVPNPLFAGGTVEQAVLEAMNARRYGLRYLPDDHLDDGPVVANFFGSRKQRGLHLLHDSNTLQRRPVMPNLLLRDADPSMAVRRSATPRAPGRSGPSRNPHL